MTNLVSTYRFQFHKDFTFKELENILPYLQKLGVGTIYASPIFTAVPGSQHGYDGLDPLSINPEIGQIEQLRQISQKLRTNNINWLQDIVPNHMAFDTRNEWLMDVLEKGPQSVYSSFFDLTWNDPMFEGRLMVPFLGSTVEDAIEKNELVVAYENNRFVLKYYEAAYPLQPLSYETILKYGGAKLPAAIEQLLAQIPKGEEEQAYGNAWDELKQQMAGLLKNEAVEQFVNNCLQQVNDDKEMIEKIISRQSYRLCHWQETDQKINYRRFFTVNGLICLNIQDENVFDHYHQLIKKLVDEKIFQGLRIDHIDGLYDPSTYLHRLRDLSGDETPVVVEKILEPGEGLPKQWPVQGTSGYDFLSLVNNLFTNKNGEKLFTKFYKNLCGEHRSIEQLVYEKKSWILYNNMAGELENLYQLFMQSNIVDKRALASIRKEELKEVIGEFLVQCPVYRYYGCSFPLEGEDAGAVQNIISRMRRSVHEIRRAIDVFESALLQKPHEGNEELNKKLAHFYQRCMQLSGPLMAKGVEDTLMYTYNRFIGHNEVGDSPESFGISIEEFHKAMTERQQNWPLSLNATSTHDTKRGEDVRARLNVLTDIGDEWLDMVRNWQQQNETSKPDGFPDANDEYFIYQTVVGAHPFPGMDEDNFSERMQLYLEKALREGKTNSSWTEPNGDYENAAKNFLVHFLHQQKPFINQKHELFNFIADHGIVNSLSQLILKFCCPGIPDVYQGCELWDLSLVDPDNRRTVDYNKRMTWLDEEDHPVINKLWEERYEGRIKLWLTQALFNLRKQWPQLFASGEYLPLSTSGEYKDHIIAFARRYRQNILVIALPLHTAALCRQQGVDVREIDWKDTTIELPEGAAEEWERIFPATKTSHSKHFAAKDLFKDLPFAILKGERLVSERGAGILLHLSSLPSPFGIGDMGPEAKVFVDFLQRSRQKYWQLLPVNPTEQGQGHSPYSSISSRAGNILFISPELLVNDGLLQADDLQQHFTKNENHTDFAAAENIRSALLEKAWRNFSEREDHPSKKDFELFVEKENEWLDDFAIYALLKQENGGKPWYEWQDDFKFHKKEALQKIVSLNNDTVSKIKWLQFIFSKQWASLKEYCNQQGVQLIGDLPFYVSYDSADVWSHRHLFALDDEGKRTGMAGVPPDAFSSDGQLWGMPVYKWEAHKEENYKWWIERLKKNIELFDIVRLDHFRAFSAYWEVPAGEATAKHGEWKESPGSELFNAVQNELGNLPFVAEDLGEIDQPVYRLRDEFKLPGMKVLQFAFGGDMPRSVHIPHNYNENFIVYTGTHDNNTTRGWFTEEADDATRLALERYIGRPVSSAEINFILARMAFGSVARTVILPVQDVLNLDGSSRMNTPASSENNWGWRLMPGQIDRIAERNLLNWTKMYNRE